MIPMKLPREEKLALIEALQTFFEEERSESLGMLGAEQLIDFMIQELGPILYNRAIFDARTLMNDRMVQLEDELYSLEKPNKYKTNR
ncbi:DUF2164 domain-containing protein [Gorillibacterium timonense]|uniref:DUF2164 domain-containing protein n=1 Tax=Gorillibacterium timonense TaxID=1689269 RepID=UPI00071D60C4|nr:DUF2164 domain-containing protein [Gorillibacterium timonense]